MKEYSRSFGSIKCMLFARNISISFRAQLACNWIANWRINGCARYLSLLCSENCTTQYAELVLFFLLGWLCQ